MTVLQATVMTGLMSALQWPIIQCQSLWCETRSVVSGRYVNAFAKNNWVLNYSFRATSEGVGTVAGLRPVQNVPGLENVDVTDKVAGPRLSCL
ncbi:DUF726-domain-containing protein [Phlegmacium glaucopus]|nr:DUF726-domain-containing protein [Phlegmacium glaucopus]